MTVHSRDSAENFSNSRLQLMRATAGHRTRTLCRVRCGLDGVERPSLSESRSAATITCADFPRPISSAKRAVRRSASQVTPADWKGLRMGVSFSCPLKEFPPRSKEPRTRQRSTRPKGNYQTRSSPHTSRRTLRAHPLPVLGKKGHESKTIAGENRTLGATVVFVPGKKLRAIWEPLGR